MNENKLHIATLIFALFILVAIGSCNNSEFYYEIKYLDANGNIIRTENIPYVNLRSAEDSRVLQYYKSSDGWFKDTVTYTGPFIIERKRRK